MRLPVESLPYFVFAATVFGIVIGSFLNVCIYRIPRNISVNGNHGRSMCRDCGVTLKWYDLIPLISYCILRGKCRWCKAPISTRYPLVEFLNAVLWGACAWFFKETIHAVIYAILCSVLLVLSFIDWDTQEIPYRFQGIILGLGLLSLFLSDFPSIKERVIGMFIISVPMVILTLLLNGFGGGDIQLMTVSGFLLGYRANVIAMIIGTLLAALLGIIVMRREKGDKRTKIPFGPFLAIGLVCALFWGESIYNWYFRLF